MIGLKVQYAHAQKTKRYLLQHDLFEKEYLIDRHEDGIVFPVKREFSAPFDFDCEFVPLRTGKRRLSGNLRDALKGLLTDEEERHLRVSYDVVGSIAIIEIPSELEEKERLVAQKVLAINPQVKTVLKKASGHEGEFRTQAMECIGGEDTRETIVVENGVRLKVDVEDTYYSVRMATERNRILRDIRPGERILCLFSGTGPYPVVFSRHSSARTILGIEINPKAHELAQENVAKNRCTSVRLMLGDAHEILPNLAEEELFDRVTMPLPHNAAEFLPETLAVCKKGSIVHYYCFAPEGEFEGKVDELQVLIEREGFSLAGHKIIRVGQYAPRVWRLCIDATLG